MDEKAQMRVEIAKDVLERLGPAAAACPGPRFAFDKKVFVQFPFRQKGMPIDADARDVLATVPRCDVCALGGMFVAAVMKYNECKAAEHLDVEGLEDPYAVSYYNQIKKYLSRWFDRDQIRLIEIAYEAGNGWNDVDQDDQDGWLAAAMFPELDRGPKRMAAIMQNIVDNGGAFVVSEQK